MKMFDELIPDVVKCTSCGKEGLKWYFSYICNEMPDNYDQRGIDIFTEALCSGCSKSRKEQRR